MDPILNKKIQNVKAELDAHKSDYASLWTTGKNLFDKDAVKSGYILNSLGNEAVNTNYSISDYIQVEPTTDYYVTFAFHYMTFYDVDKNKISTIEAATTKFTFKTPNNTKYLRFTAYNSYLYKTQIESGTVETSYEDYKYQIAKELLEDKDFNINDVPDNIIPVQKTNFITIGKNLFDKNNVTGGYFINQTTGALSANAIYSASDYISVNQNTQYALSVLGNVRLAFYNANKVYISGLYPVTNPITTPENTAYIRFSAETQDLNSQQLELGSAPTYYENYGNKFTKEIRSKAIDIFLPSEICIAVGRTIEIYNRQVVCVGNINNYHFRYVCAVGKSMRRKWTHTGTADKLGTFPLTLTVYDNEFNEVGKAVTNIKVVTATISATSLCCIGDSLTNGKDWLSELKTLSNNAITYVGTRTTGLTAGGHEGRSGATAAWYLANSSYTFDSNFDGSGTDGTVNPFWNPNTSAFDYAYYKSTYGKNPTAIQIFLGTNGITLDATTNANNIKSIVDGIRASDATIPIFVVYTLYRGGQDGIGKQLSTDGYSAGSGIWKYEEDKKVFNLMVKLNELLKDYTDVHFVPVSLCHDSENNFKNPAITTAVNPRSAITEIQDSEATHPQEAGYLQMADIMLSTMAAYL